MWDDDFSASRVLITIGKDIQKPAGDLLNHFHNESLEVAGSKTMLLTCNHWYMYNNTVKVSAKNKKSNLRGTLQKSDSRVTPIYGLYKYVPQDWVGFWGS